MAIVHVGTVVLQVERRDSRREFVEELIAEINKHMRWIATRCIEEALEREVMSLLGGAGMSGADLRERRQRSNAIDAGRGMRRTFGETVITHGIWTRLGAGCGSGSRSWSACVREA